MIYTGYCTQIIVNSANVILYADFDTTIYPFNVKNGLVNEWINKDIIFLTEEESQGKEELKRVNFSVDSDNILEKYYLLQPEDKQKIPYVLANLT